MVCALETAVRLEQALLCAWHPQYNISKLATASNLGVKRSAETRKRQSEAAKGKPGIRGTANVTAKLTNGDVLRIRFLHRYGGLTLMRLGLKFGVHLSQISNIVNRKQWIHI